MSTDHSAVIKALREAGCAVCDISCVGRGCPNLLVSRAGETWLLAFRGDMPLAKRRLSATELKWCDAWRGRVLVVHSIGEAIATL